MLAEAKRQEQLVAEERALRTDVEREAREKQQEIVRLSEEIQAASARRVSDAQLQRRLWAGLGILGSVLAAGSWYFDAEIAGRLTDAWRLGASYAGALGSVVRLIGAAILIATVFPAVAFMKRQYRNIIRVILVSCALGASDLIGIANAQMVAGYLAIAAPIATILVIVLHWLGVLEGEQNDDVTHA